MSAVEVNDELAMLLEQASRLFTNLIDRDLLRTAESGSWPAKLWNEIESFGLPDALTVAPVDGGLAFSMASSLFGLFGQHALPLPIGETMLARAVLSRAGIDVPSGPIELSDADALRETSGLISGFVNASWVAIGAVAHVVACIASDHAPRVALLACADAEAMPLASDSRVPRFALAFKNCKPIAMAPWPEVPNARMLGAMLRSSQMAGAIERVLTMSIQYAGERQQFGRPIGRFQAVQQLLAQLAGEVAAASSSAESAWFALDAGDCSLAAMVAKIRTGEAARRAAAIAHQVHGAIGVTDEHMLHYFTRRLLEWRLDFGNDGEWAESLGHQVLRSREGLWHLLTDSGETR
jgi:acyl-CoA dehydrogenase